MNLVPVRLPGPNARKARAFSSEMLKLRAQGYTFEAIREALAGAGVHVSNSTVQREVARAAGRPPGSVPADAAASHRRPLQTPSTSGASVQARSIVSPTALASAAISQDNRATGLVSGFDGKEGAEAFFDAHPSNPFFATKETS